MWYCTVFFGLLSLWYVLRQLLNKKRCNPLANLPCRQRLPLLGNLTDFLNFVSGPGKIHPTSRFFQYLEGMALIYRGKGMFVMWVGPKPILVLSSPDTVEPALSSNDGTEISMLSKYFRPWIGNGLFLSKGSLWQRQRKFLNPSFHVRVLENFLPIMNEQVAILVEQILEASSTRNFLDSCDFFHKCTLDIVCETAMGTRIDAQRSDSTVAKKCEEVLNDIYERINRPWLHPDFLFFRTGRGKAFQNTVSYLHDFSKKVISERMSSRKLTDKLDKVSDQEFESAKKRRLALLDLILDSWMSQQEIREQVDAFVFSGHGTTSVAASWMTYLIGRHPDVQNKLVQEVDEVFDGDRERHVTQEDLRKLKYMEMVIKETLRMYPSVPTMPKKLPKDTEIGGHLIPKGTECILNFFSVHHDPNYFPDPDVFDPERFSPEHSFGRHPSAFVPFSSGPRNCIGQRFAMMELKILCSHILRHFRVVSLDPPDKIVLLPTGVLNPDRSLRIQFIPKN